MCVNLLLKIHQNLWLMETQIKTPTATGRESELVKAQIEACILQIKVTAVIIQQIDDNASKEKFVAGRKKLYRSY